MATRGWARQLLLVGTEASADVVEMPGAQAATNRRGPTRYSALRFLLAAIYIGVTVTGCILVGGVRGPERVPSVIGLIAAVEPRPGNERLIKLEDGRDVLITADVQLLEGSAVPQSGDLVLADVEVDDPWWIALPRVESWEFIDECFQLGTGYAEERDGRIVTEQGLVIEKGKNYDPRGAEHDGRYDNSRGTAFCLDKDGCALAASSS